MHIVSTIYDAMAVVEKCRSGRSYIIEVSITEQSSTTCNHRPKALPSTLLGFRDAAATLYIRGTRIYCVVFGLESGRHGNVACPCSLNACTIVLEGLTRARCQVTFFSNGDPSSYLFTQPST
jgi:hypothetical protein